MITDVITAGKDKKNIFDKEYIEVLLPVSDEGFEILEAKCPDALKQIHWCLDNEKVKTAWIDLKIAFDFENKETYFYIITNCYYKEEGDTDTWIDSDLCGSFTFDSETAEYFKNKAIWELINSFEAMANCEFKDN